MVVTALTKSAHGAHKVSADGETGPWPHPHLVALTATSAFQVGEFRCPGVPAESGVEAAPYPEIVLPRLGSCLRIDTDGQVLLNRTTLAFFEAQRPYQIRHFRPAPDVTTVISITNLDALHDALGVLLPEGRAFARSAIAMPPTIVLAHRQLISLCRQGPPGLLGAQEIAAGIILSAVGSNLANSRDIVKPGHGMKKVNGDPYLYADAACQYLAHHYASAVSLQQLADEIGVSPFHLCRLFQAVTGISVHQHLIRLRLDAAVDRLLDSRDSVTEIALQVGFSSHSHLTSAFTRAFGRPPRAVRRGTRPMPLATDRQDLAKLTRPIH